MPGNRLLSKNKETQNVVLKILLHPAVVMLADALSFLTQ